MDGWDGLLTKRWMNVEWGNVPKNEVYSQPDLHCPGPEGGLSDHMKKGCWFPHPQEETWHKVIIFTTQQSNKREW
jgi:hypothetical protein